MVVVPFDDVGEAIAVANGTEFGLYDYVFSADTSGDARPRWLRLGNVGINTAQRNHEAPGASSSPAWVATAAASASMPTELQSIVWPG